MHTDHNDKPCVHTYNKNVFPKIISIIQNCSQIVDLYQLQVNKYVLSFLKGFLPSSLKHIFTISQNQHGRSTIESTAYKLMVQKTRTFAACQSIIQIGPQTWNLLPHDIYMHNSLLISHVIQMIHIGGLRWLIHFFGQCIYGAAYSFNEWDRVMGTTPERQRQIYIINHYLLCKIDYISHSAVEWLQLKL